MPNCIFPHVRKSQNSQSNVCLCATGRSPSGEKTTRVFHPCDAEEGGISIVALALLLGRGSASKLHRSLIDDSPTSLLDALGRRDEDDRITCSTVRISTDLTALSGKGKREYVPRTNSISDCFLTFYIRTAFISHPKPHGIERKGVEWSGTNPHARRSALVFLVVCHENGFLDLAEHEVAMAVICLFPPNNTVSKPPHIVPPLNYIPQLNNAAKAARQER